jgi:5'-nucleotidase
VAAAAGLALVGTPLALTSGAVADDSSSSTAYASARSAKFSHLQLLAINDFHGQLEKLDATKTSSGRVNATPAGGAEYLSTHLQQLRATAQGWGAKSLTVAAGDLIGATPLLSAAFHDEPTIEAMNLMGLDVTSVGNHEFDEGYKELKRMQNGGCIADGTGANNQNSCPDHEFGGADFNYLAANVKKVATGKTLFKPYTIKKVNGHKVGFIGMTLQDTPNIVTKSGVEGLKFTDEVKTANKLVPELKAKGVQAIVVLLHEGVAPTTVTDINACDYAEGSVQPGIEIAKALDPEIDLVISGHTHFPYTCTVRDPHGHRRMITSAYSVGRVITELNLTIKNSNGDVVRSRTTATNHIVTNTDTSPDAALTALIARYQGLVAPIANEVLGQIAPAESSNNLSRSNEANGFDSLVGNLITDSQRVDPSIVPAGQTTPVVAFMNPGGIRADLVENAAGDVTYGAAFSVQPFNNYDASLDLTGAQILALLNEQWNGKNESTDPTKWKVLQVSGLKYTWDKSLAAEVGTDALVGPVLIDANGDGTVADTEVINPATTYRVAANAFLADGGDGFATFSASKNKYLGGLDIDALSAYLKAHNPYTPTALDRISAID